MNRKQFIFLLVVLVVLGSAGLVMLNQHKESWSVHEAKMGDKVLADFRPNDVAAIHIKGFSELNVVRTNDGWRVQESWNYPANFGQISDLLIKLKDLKVVEAEPVGPADLARVTLDEPGKGNDSGTLVEFKDAQGKVLASLLAGKKHMHQQGDSTRASLVGSEPDGRYILLPSDPKNVLLVSNTLAIIEPRAAAWLSRDFFKVESPKSFSLAANNPADSWKLSRETESSPWVLADIKPGETLDAKKVPLAANALAFPSFSEVFSNTPSVGTEKPMVLTVETFDNFTYTIKTSPRLPDEKYHMTVTVAANILTERVAGNKESPDDKKKLDAEFQGKTKKLQAKLKQEQALAPWAYDINSWIIDPVMVTRPQLLEGYKDEKAASVQSPEPVKPAKTDSLPGAPGWTPRVIK